MSSNQITNDKDEDKIKHFFHTASIPELKEFISFCDDKNSQCLSELADLTKQFVNIYETQNQKTVIIRA